MDVFDTIGEIKSLREVADEWRAADVDQNISTDTINRAASAEDFEQSVKLVIHRHAELRMHFQSRYRPSSVAAGEALEAAIQQAVTVEGRLEDLLALRGDQALLFLEALQSVSVSFRARQHNIS
jgi:hypothetical protein